MKIEPINKGRWIYECGEVFLDTVTDKSLWFNVGENEHKVKLWYEDGVLKYSCDCPQYGIKGAAKGGLCSHLVAVLLYVANKKGKVYK